MHYITITFKIIALHYDYNYRGFDNVMHYITITSQSNALHYDYLKGFRTLFIYIMKCHGIQTIPYITLKHPWPNGKGSGYSSGTGQIASEAIRPVPDE